MSCDHDLTTLSLPTSHERTLLHVQYRLDEPATPQAIFLTEGGTEVEVSEMLNWNHALLSLDQIWLLQLARFPNGMASVAEDSAADGELENADADDAGGLSA